MGLGLHMMLSDVIGGAPPIPAAAAVLGVLGVEVGIVDGHGAENAIAGLVGVGGTAASLTPHTTFAHSSLTHALTSAAAGGAAAGGTVSVVGGAGAGGAGGAMVPQCGHGEELGRLSVGPSDVFSSAVISTVITPDPVAVIATDVSPLPEVSPVGRGATLQDPTVPLTYSPSQKMRARTSSVLHSMACKSQGVECVPLLWRRFSCGWWRRALPKVCTVWSPRMSSLYDTIYLCSYQFNMCSPMRYVICFCFYVYRVSLRN